MAVETWGRKKGGPTAAHVACAESWLPGIKHLIEHGVPFDLVDRLYKAPLAYIADQHDINGFRLLTDYLTHTGQKSTLKSVWLSTENGGSVSFLSYCVLTRNSSMVNCCHRAYDRQMIDDVDVEQACADWKARYPSERMPRFLSVFEKMKIQERELEIVHLFAPLVAYSQFAGMDSANSADVKETVIALDNLRMSVMALRNWSLLAPPAGMPSFSVASRIITTFPEHFLTGELINQQIAFEYTPHDILKMYFRAVLNELFEADRGYLRPRRSKDGKAWFGFGVVLAHIGAIGCHYTWPTPLDPLVWAAVRGDLERPPADYIEQYFLVLDPASIQKMRGDLIQSFQKAQLDCVVQYQSELSAKWDAHMRDLSNAYNWIHRGFWARPTRDFELTPTSARFDQFRATIKQTSVPAIRLWYEGFRRDTSARDVFRPQITWAAFFEKSVCWRFRTSNDPQRRVDINRMKQFAQAFLRWIIHAPDAHLVVAAMCGVSGLITLTTYVHKIIVIGDDAAWHASPESARLPKVLLPKQKPILYAVADVPKVFGQLAWQVGRQDGLAPRGAFDPETPEILRHYPEKLLHDSIEFDSS
jgi:hypothetical protein